MSGEVKYSPVHQKMSEAAATDLFNYGAVLLAGAVDPHEVRRFGGALTIESIDDLFEEIPSIEHSIGAFVAAQTLYKTSLRLLDLSPHVSGISIHDQEVPRGVSLAIPLRETATLSVSERQFTAKYYRHDMATMRWSYGPGDIAVIRQDIRQHNGKRLKNPKFAMYHLGLSSKTRRLAILGLHMDNLQTKFD